MFRACLNFALKLIKIKKIRFLFTPENDFYFIVNDIKADIFLFHTVTEVFVSILCYQTSKRGYNFRNTLFRIICLWLFTF